jgi:hypothetical protein
MRVQAVRDFIASGENRTRKRGEVLEVSDEEATNMIRAGQVRLHQDPSPAEHKGSEYKGTVSDPDRRSGDDVGMETEKPDK